MTKIVKIKEVNIHIFWETQSISIKFLGKMWLTVTLKVAKNKPLQSLQTVYFLKYIFRVKAYGFWFLNEWNFNISFCQISNLSFYLSKIELRKNFWDAWYVLFGIWFAHVCRVYQNIGTHAWSRMVVLW